MIADTPKIAREFLNSWKEIATYLKRGVRTVQRWEAELGLPVRRPRGKRHSSVVATRSELDQWMISRPRTGVENGGPGIRFGYDGLRFLLTEIQTGLTFAHLASTAQPAQTERIERNIRNARKAYSTVLRFQPQVELNEEATMRVNVGMERLKAVLERFAGVSSI